MSRVRSPSWAGATPGRWSAQTPAGSASGRSRPNCAKTMLRVDIVADIGDDADVDSGVVTERDIRVDHDNFNLVDNSRIARESPTSSRSTEEDSPSRDRTRRQAA